MGSIRAEEDPVTSGPVRVGVSIPPAGFKSRDEADAYVNAAADGGLDHMITADHVAFRGGQGRDGLMTMAWLAGLHPTIGLYVGVYLLALRHPVAVARQVSTLAEDAPGRLTLGIGVGGEDRHEMESVGVDPATRGRRTDEALDVLLPLLGGSTVDHDGEFFQVPDTLISPVPDPPVVVTVGGRSGAAITRAGTRGQGWLASWCSPKRFADGVALSEEAALSADRTGVTWRHGYQVWVGLGDTPEEGAGILGPAMESFYAAPFSRFQKYSPVGTPSEIAAWLAPFVDGGATDFNLAPVAGTPSEAIAGLAEVKRILKR